MGRTRPIPSHADRFLKLVALWVRRMGVERRLWQATVRQLKKTVMKVVVGGLGSWGSGVLCRTLLGALDPLQLLVPYAPEPKQWGMSKQRPSLTPFWHAEPTYRGNCCGSFSRDERMNVLL